MSRASCCFSKINAASNLALVSTKFMWRSRNKFLFICFENSNHCSRDGWIYFLPMAPSTLCLTLKVVAVGRYKCNCSSLHGRTNTCAQSDYQQARAAALMYKALIKIPPFRINVSIHVGVVLRAQWKLRNLLDIFEDHGYFYFFYTLSLICSCGPIIRSSPTM